MSSIAQLIQRLFSHTEVGAPDECWLWKACVTESGHGRIRVGDKIKRAHRVAYEIFVEPIPPGDVVRHTCDVPNCINPNHLLAGTRQDNVDDMVKRGRNRNGWAKITPEDAENIRERLALGEPKSEVAARYKLSVEHVRRIEKREVWQNAEGFGEEPAPSYNENSTPF